MMLVRQLASFFLVFAGTTTSLVQALEVLVFTETAAFRHPVLDQAAYKEFEKGATAKGHNLEQANSSTGYFTPSSLAKYDVVVFFITSGGEQGLLTQSEQQAFEGFIQNGGGFVGVHAALGTYQKSWLWYRKLIGATFRGHPEKVTPATIRVEDKSHASTKNLPTRWQVEDEIFNLGFEYPQPIRQSLHVLATATNFKGGNLGPDHPIMWCHEYDGGRSWYTGLGHTPEMWQDNSYLVDSVVAGVEWAAGANTGDALASQDVHFTKTDVNTNTNRPLAGAVTSDENDDRFFWIERETGRVQFYSPTTGKTEIAQTVPVFSGLEDGLLGIAFDPDFTKGRPYIYLYYSPVGNKAENRISRFTMSGNTFDLATEKVVLTIPTQRKACCHSGGHLNFDKKKHLWLTVGDNTNGFKAGGYSPLDERPGFANFDSQKSASSTNDLRGKILRIKVNDNGEASCPEGNLFYPGDATHRCEIYTMGNRNPFRMAINPFQDNTIYWGEVGPDAAETTNERGAIGSDEVNKASSAGNYGWPYCIADNKPYVEYDFATEKSGAPYKCNAPVNDSPNRNGDPNLPPARPAMIWYDKSGFRSDEEAIPEGKGMAPLVVYMHEHEPNRFGDCALPEYYSGSMFFSEWSREKLVQYIMDDKGDLLHAIPLWDSFTFNKVIDIVKANDGSIYVVEYGNFSGSNPSKISRMCYTKNNFDKSSCIANASPVSGTFPLKVSFSAIPDEPNLKYEWDFNKDGNTDSTKQNPSYTFNSPGTKLVKARVYNPNDSSVDSTCSVTISVSAPDNGGGDGDGDSKYQVNHLLPPFEGGIVDWDATIVHQVEVYDEKGESPMASKFDCEGVQLDSSLGHEDHAHGIDFDSGTCYAEFKTLEADGHSDKLDWLFWALKGTYTDPDTKKIASETMQLHSRMRQAEKFDAAKRKQCMANDLKARSNPTKGCTIKSTDQGGGLVVGWIQAGSWLRYDNYNPHNTDRVTFRVASKRKGKEIAIIEMRVDAPDGPVIATASVPGTGSWRKWKDVTVPLQDPNQFFEMELKSKQSVSGIQLDCSGFPQGYARGYQVYVAGDDYKFGSPLEPVHRAEPNPDKGPKQVITFKEVATGVKHIRILQTGSHKWHWWSIHEASVYDEQGKKVQINSAKASRNHKFCPVKHAIDGNPKTRWCTKERQRFGPYDIYLVFKEGADSTTKWKMFNLNWFRFDGGHGVSSK